jgi:hypothetical protein
MGALLLLVPRERAAGPQGPGDFPAPRDGRLIRRRPRSGLYRRPDHRHRGSPRSGAGKFSLNPSGTTWRAGAGSTGPALPAAGSTSVTPPASRSPRRCSPGAPIFPRPRPPRLRPAARGRLHRALLVAGLDLRLAGLPPEAWRASSSTSTPAAPRAARDLPPAGAAAAPAAGADAAGARPDRPPPEPRPRHRRPSTWPTAWPR